MEFKGTPGPWVARGGEVTTADYARDGNVYTDHICNCEVINGSSPNARLIAAAPDLLDQLIRLRNKIADYHPDDDDHLDVVDAVINKALGRE